MSTSTWENIDWGNDSAGAQTYKGLDDDPIRSSFTSVGSTSTEEGSLPTSSTTSPEKRPRVRAMNRRGSWFDGLFENTEEDDQTHPKKLCAIESEKNPHQKVINRRGSWFDTLFDNADQDRATQTKEPSAAKVTHSIPTSCESKPITQATRPRMARRSSDIVLGTDRTETTKERPRVTRRSSWFDNLVPLGDETIPVGRADAHASSAKVRSSQSNMDGSSRHTQYLRQVSSDTREGLDESAKEIYARVQKSSNAIMDYVDRAVQVLAQDDVDDELEVPFPSVPRRIDDDELEFHVNPNRAGRY